MKEERGCGLMKNSKMKNVSDCLRGKFMGNILKRTFWKYYIYLMYVVDKLF